KSSPTVSPLVPTRSAAAAPASGKTRWRLPMSERANSVALLSLGSRRSHVILCSGVEAAHCPRSTDLPYPGGATTVVTRDLVAAATRRTNSVRRIAKLGSCGATSLALVVRVMVPPGSAELGERLPTNGSGDAMNVGEL